MSLPLNQIVCGDAFEVLKGFPESSIDMIMFSPPYWGLRDYKIPKVDDVFAVAGLGLESHPKRYVERMVVLGRLLKRVLKKSGSLWLNMGDTYFGGHSGAGAAVDPDTISFKGKQNIAMPAESVRSFKTSEPWLQPKQKLLIPERCATALQEDGWILRNDVIWHKPNHMPSSVKDRLTNSWEHLYFFVKSRRYYFDLDAIRQPHKEGVIRWGGNVMKVPKQQKEQQGQAQALLIEQRLWRNPLGKNPDDTITAYQGKFEGFAEESEQYGSPRARNERNKQPYQNNNPHTMRQKEGYIALDPTHPNDLSHPLGKNPDDFWPITTQPYPEAHFATYPERLCENPIKATCPKNGIVLDPMCGSGTTCLAAFKLGRNYIGIDFNPNYVDLANKRLGNQCRLFEKPQQPHNEATQ